jgi:tetratricopeptide (TPR) repeat protein
MSVRRKTLNRQKLVKTAYEKGTSFLAALRFQEARDAFEEVLVEDPESVVARVELARLHMMMGESEQVEQWYAEAEERAPSNAAVIGIRGLLALSTGDIDSARKAFEAALAIEPNDRMSLVNLALCHRAAGNFATAEASLRRALELEPTAFGARFDLAIVFGQTGRTKEAIHELVETLRQNPLHLKSYLALGVLYKLSGHGNLAIEIYTEGLRHNPHAHPIREELRDLLALRLDLPAALHQAKELVRRRCHPSDLLSFGKLAVAAGEIEKAEAAFRLAIELAPNHWGPHYNLAEVYRAAGFHDEALACYQHALDHAEGDYRPYNGLGLFLMSSDERFVEARDLLAKAVELAPERAEPHLNLAIACARLSQYDKAIMHARAAEQRAIKGDTLCIQANELAAAIERELTP